ncbi:MAG: Hsp33 family molecular chaperone HslO, partial [Clostridia bacterium]|nr:Hsp33 family molecular chaperone HslO [Clostridia bacterium]
RFSPVYRCTCSLDRVERALISTGREELLDMARDPETRVGCRFCGKEYVFTPEDIGDLLRRAGSEE